MEFIKRVLAVLVGLICFGIVVVFGFIMFIAVLTASTEKTVNVVDNSVLRLDLRGEFHELVPDDPWAEVFDSPVALSVLNATKAIEEAKNDDRISGLYISSSFFSGGYASLRELREAILDFKESGKFVHAYGEFYTEGGYYLASVADRISLHPQGSVELNGLSANVSFFKGSLDKLDIEPQIFRVGEFKSAIEPFIREDLSAENRLQLEEWLGTLNGQITKEISEARGMDHEQVLEISNSMLVTNADNAESNNLITDINYADEARLAMIDALGIDEDDDIDFITTQSYYDNWYASADLPRDRIAVVVAEGEILGGKGNNYQVGSEKFASTIKKIRENKRVKAMVMRINSPGGGTVASDVIWREIMLTKEKMPVVASMADMATSGGYYLAMPCDEIIAQPTTLTGSIGVFGMLFNFGGMLNNKLGVSHDVVRTGEFSDIFTVTRSLSEQEREIIQKEVQRTYDIFISKAAEGRGVDNGDIEAVAGGRVWVGSTAQEIGLVDQMGGFKDALEAAAERAEIDEYQVVYYPEPKNFFEEFAEDFGAQAKSMIFGDDYKVLEPYADLFEKLKGYTGIQARLPYELTIE